MTVLVFLAVSVVALFAAFAGAALWIHIEQERRQAKWRSRYPVQVCRKETATIPGAKLLPRSVYLRCE